MKKEEKRKDFTIIFKTIVDNLSFRPNSLRVQTTPSTLVEATREQLLMVFTRTVRTPRAHLRAHSPLPLLLLTLPRCNWIVAEIVARTLLVN